MAWPISKPKALSKAAPLPSFSTEILIASGKFEKKNCGKTKVIGQTLREVSSQLVLINGGHSMAIGNLNKSKETKPKRPP